MELPPNFTITGAELIAKGTDSFGFKWPDDWECNNNNLLPWGRCIDIVYPSLEYRIKPALLKPPKPRLLRLRDTELHDNENGRRIWTTAGSGYDRIPFIELTPEVRRRLGEDAGVDWEAEATRIANANMREGFYIARQLVADGKVDYNAL